jgi:hypothetical protein
VFDDAFAHGESEIEPAESGITFFKPGDDAKGVQVVVEAKAVLVQGFVERFFSSVAEGWMADVVGESESFCEFRVEAESVGDGAGDLSDFKRVGEAAAEVIAGEVAGEAGEYLGFAGEAAEGSCMEDAGAVASEGGAIGMVGFGILPGREVSFALHGDIRRKKQVRVNLIAHPESIDLSSLVITQWNAGVHAKG